MLVGESCTATEKPWDMMTRMLSPYGGGALAPYVVGAIGLALWDLKGKLPQRSANELLGGPVRERIDRYATGNDTDWYLESGFRATKLACPYGTAAGLGALDANEPFIAQKRQLVPTQAVARQSVDIFQPDIAWAGGMTGCLKITHIAEGAGLPVILHAGVNTPYAWHAKPARRQRNALRRAWFRPRSHTRRGARDDRLNCRAWQPFVTREQRMIQSFAAWCNFAASVAP